MYSRSPFLKKIIIVVIIVIILYTPRFVDEANMENFLNDCCNYFMEVISGLCFGHDNPPEKELIKMLMDIIFINKKTSDLTPFKDGRTKKTGKTRKKRDLTPFQGGKSDETPTIRSPLIQLLMNFK